VPEVLRTADTDREELVARAADALRSGKLVVLPTDTVYGVAADAFSTAGTARVFRAKRRSRRFPLPVLVRGPKQLIGLVDVIPPAAERLMAAYWPGAITLVLPAAATLAWDLGESDGTVAVRMPFDDLALEVIRAVGPLACTSANLSGRPPARDVEDALAQLGGSVAVYLDDGPRHDAEPSAIVDLTTDTPRVLRAGTLTEDEITSVAAGES